MKDFIKLLALVGMASAAVIAPRDDVDDPEDIHIELNRFADKTCQAPHHIRKTTDMHAGTCKTFSDDEIPFHALQFRVTESDIDHYECSVIAYPQANCLGEPDVFHLKEFENGCNAVSFEGRSAAFQCRKPPKATPKVVVPTTFKAFPTVTLVEKPAATKVCHMETPSVAVQ